MKTKYVISLLMACLVIMGITPLTLAIEIPGVNNSDKMKLFKELSDDLAEGKIKAPPSPDISQPPKEAKSNEKSNEKVMPHPVSNIEKILSGDFPEGIERKLHQYGYDFFQNKNISFGPDGNVPVGLDYIIGPGDNFKINIWGKFEDTYNVTVNRDGGIIIPRIGTVNVNGLSYAEMKTHLYNKFKEYYTDFQISITMGELRSIGIFVVGEAMIPGTYSVSSLSTLMTALFEVNGPNKNGSLRNIQLIRNSNVITTIDLYQFFLNGDKSQDHRLEPGDTIFIPVIGPVAGIAGNVRRQAIYELKKGKISTTSSDMPVVFSPREICKI